MSTYEKNYLLLFNGISDTVREMENTAQSMAESELCKELEKYITALRRLQQLAEDMYISNQD